jgi:hypothetical protein
MVDEHKSVEEWADALLDQHRAAAPRGAAGAPDDPDGSPAEDEPFMLRLFAKLGGDTSNPVLRERLRRDRERFATLAKIDAVLCMITIVGLCAFAFVVSSLP